jgi:outer membrane protein TolC
LQQVADILQALAQDAELVDAQRQLLESASTALALQRESYAAGKSDVLQLIIAERAYQQARLGMVTAQARRLQDTAQLFVALGGAWWEMDF